ncbi:MAG: ATP-grasp domain-containing protein [Bacteroidales bacterium]|nr:ATP-grasp domain-containing protein [Bacteroidales bacterium]
MNKQVKPKIAIIGGSYLQLPLIKKCKELGIETHCFAWLEGAVCKDFADHFYPISIIQKEQILDICRTEAINGICTIASDVAAPTVAYVAEKLGLNGNSYESACNANNKFMMRKLLQQAGILCPQFFCITNIDQVHGIEWRFPLIVKPTDRSGSLGVSKVNNKEELILAIEKAINFSFKGEAIVEEFIDGREISVECISYHGKHYPLQITDKVTTNAPHFVELEHHQPAELSESLYEEIYSITTRALEALGLKEGASHSEYKITDKGSIYIMEIGGRMGGDFIGSDLVELSTGYDFLKGVIEVSLNSFNEPQIHTKKYSGIYFLSKETEEFLPFFKNLISSDVIVEINQTSTDLKDLTCSADRSGYIIYQSDKSKWNPRTIL